MQYIIKPLILSFLLTVSVMPIYLKVLTTLKLFDKPDNNRKIHNDPIPRLGGLIIFLILIFVLIVVDLSSIHNLKYFLIGSLVILFVGLIDDLFGLEWWLKFILQMLAIFFMFINIFGNHNYQFTIFDFNINYHFGISLLFFICLGAINSFNLIDGLDGLLSSYVILILFLMVTSTNYTEGSSTIIKFSLFGILMGFILFNQNPARIFLGDAGSLMLGYVLIYLALSKICVSENSNLIVIDIVKVSILFSLPMLDTIRLIFTRIAKNISPFLPDRNHIHHILLEYGLSVNQAVIALNFLTLISIAIYLIYLRNIELGFVFLIIFSLLIFFIKPILKFIRNNRFVEIIKITFNSINNYPINDLLKLVLIFLLFIPIFYSLIYIFINLKLNPLFFQNDILIILAIYVLFYLIISLKMSHKLKSEIILFSGLLSYLILLDKVNFMKTHFAFLYISIPIIFFSILLFVALLINSFLDNKINILYLEKKHILNFFNIFEINLFFNFLTLITSYFILENGTSLLKYFVYGMIIYCFYFVFKVSDIFRPKYSIYFYICSLFFIVITAILK